MNLRILKTIRIFAENECKQTNNRQHNFDHLTRVRNNALWIIEVLNIKGLDINLIQAACYLHDIVIIRRKSKNVISKIYDHLFERQLNRKYIEPILRQFDLPEEEEKTIASAIINHNHSIPYRILNKDKDMYSKVLEDADSLDYASKYREKSFQREKNGIMIHLSHIYLEWVRKNMKSFLNFPELAELNLTSK